MRSEQFRFFVFTCRDPESDFRLSLVDNLRKHHETYYIWLRRRPIVSGPGNNDPMTEMSLMEFLRFVCRFRQDDRINIYFNSTNTYFPGIISLLRGVMTAGLWCMDMHDDLRYHKIGLKRLQESLIISLLRRLSHVTVHAAHTLQELFADSHHLGNASDIPRLSLAPDNHVDVLIVASFDERFDFDFVAKLAELAPTARFHLHGWTKSHATETIAAISAITARNNNVIHHGPYTMAELPGILSKYRISLAPYLTDRLITRYIDPLRFYHCLNAGLEVISTDIPQARYMADWIHIVPNVAACAETLKAVQAGQLAKQPAYSPITWEQRADSLIAILRRLPRMAGLQRKRDARLTSA